MARIERASGVIVVAALALACPATAQDKPVPKQTEKPEKPQSDESVEAIATQPAKDIGVVKTKVPPLLITARNDPYSLSGMTSCAKLAAAMADLNILLGPDLESGNGNEANSRLKITSGTVAGLIVPFRGIIREVSGAASAQRELEAAIAAGFARRGFLRGVHSGRKCRNKI